MVGAAVAEGELVRLVAGREAEQLVAEADAEHGHAAEQLPHDLHLVGERLRVAGAVREQDGVVGEQLLRIDRVREDGDVRAGAGEAAQDRALAAVVEDGDPERARVAVDVRLGRRDLGDERSALHRRSRPDGVERLRLVQLTRGRDRAHGAAVAQAEDERARVDPGQRDDPVLLQPGRPLRAARLPHQHRLRVRSGRLGAAGGDAVVADHRRREADELLGEARVGDGLLVAGHRGREDGLAERGAGGADRRAAEDRAVLEREEGAHPCTTRPSATVFSTAPRSFRPSSQELAERERKPLSVTVHSCSRSSRTRLARAPTSTLGSGRPSARAGPPDMRSSSVSSGTSPVWTRWV